MKAETETGEIITLEKECKCIYHNEPHWVWMDITDNERLNRRLKEAVDGGCEKYLVPLSFVLKSIGEEKLMLLAALKANMKRLSIVRLIREPSDELSNLQKQEIKNRTDYVLGLLKNKQLNEPSDDDEKRIFIEKKSERLQIGY